MNKYINKNKLNEDNLSINISKKNSQSSFSNLMKKMEIISKMLIQ